MKRAVSTAAASVAAFAAVLGLHSATTKSRLVTAPQPAQNGNASTTTTAPGASPGPSGPSTVPTTAGVSGGTSTFVGASEQYGYGVLSVKLTMNGSHIVDITLANLQVAESYSQMLAQQVIPMLKSEVLSAQSAQVNGISGASYTTQAYLLSVQSALDKARS